MAWSFWLAAGIFLLLAGLRHPLVWRRLLTLVPILFAISILIFTIVQLPPGDFVTSKAVELSITGDTSSSAQLEDIRQNFHFDEPAWQRYMRWAGFTWFTSFKAEDAGLLQGNLGRSMERNESVNDILGDSIGLTVVISIFTILFTWAVALPIGIYSAVRPYSLGDYALTLGGFGGQCLIQPGCARFEGSEDFSGLAVFEVAQDDLQSQGMSTQCRQ